MSEADKEECEYCNGTGLISFIICEECEGTGIYDPEADVRICGSCGARGHTWCSRTLRAVDLFTKKVDDV